MDELGDQPGMMAINAQANPVGIDDLDTMRCNATGIYLDKTTGSLMTTTTVAGAPVTKCG